MRTNAVKSRQWIKRWSALLLAASICVSAFAATDADPRLADSPITAKSLGDFEKPEPDDAHPHIENVKDADVVELPAPTKSNALPPGTVDVSPVVRVPQDIVPPTKTPSEQHVETRESSASIDTSLDENLIKERQKMAKEKAGASLQTAPRSLEKNTPKPLENVQAPPAPDVKLVVPAKPITEPGYASVLTGTLLVNTELNAETQPHLIRGVLIVPARVTLKINAGATIHLRSDVNAPKPLQTGVPDPSKGAAIWVYGTLLIAGDNGHPVEFAGQDKENANVLLYGAESSKIEGTRFKGTDVAQNGGVCQWINCEFNDSKYYALASGAGQFTHCSFKKCGGIFAAYEEGPWALLVRRCLFDNCRDGVLLNRDPGQACLLVERNNFIGTRGANLRAMPRAGATSSKNAEELLIGENWYGTTIEEDIDRRIVDRRTEPTIKAHLNTRPPSEKPYANTGAGAPQTSIANTLNDQQNASTKMLAALVAKQKALGDKSKIALEKTALNAKEIVKKDAKN